MNINVLVTGANSKLGNGIHFVSSGSDNHYLFTEIGELDIADLSAVRQVMKSNQIDIIVNSCNIQTCHSDEFSSRVKQPYFLCLIRQKPKRFLV